MRARRSIRSQSRRGVRPVYASGDGGLSRVAINTYARTDLHFRRQHDLQAQRARARLAVGIAPSRPRCRLAGRLRQRDDRPGAGNEAQPADEGVPDGWLFRSRHAVLRRDVRDEAPACPGRCCSRNISYKFFPTGHMVYVNEDALRGLHDATAAFIHASEKGPVGHRLSTAETRTHCGRTLLLSSPYDETRLFAGKDYRVGCSTNGIAGNRREVR